MSYPVLLRPLGMSSSNYLVPGINILWITSTPIFGKVFARLSVVVLPETVSEHYLV